MVAGAGVGGQLQVVVAEAVEEPSEVPEFGRSIAGPESVGAIDPLGHVGPRAHMPGLVLLDDQPGHRIDTARQHGSLGRRHPRRGNEAIRAASSPTNTSSPSAGNARVTDPYRSASSASKSAQPSTISNARSRPHRSAPSCDDAQGC